MPHIVTNLVDRIVTYFSPKSGVTRAANRMQLSALSEMGYVIPGSRRKSMKGLVATAGSASRDIVSKIDGMRALSRDLAMNTPLVSSVLDRHTVQSVGNGLQLQSRVDADVLGLDADAVIASQRSIEREYDLWSGSVHSDYNSMMSFAGLQSLIIYNMLLNGDVFFAPLYRPAKDPLFPYQLCVHVIDADLVRNPDTAVSTTRNIDGGIQYANDGTVEGYWVWDTYPDQSLWGRGKGSAKYVPRYNANGLQQIYHVYDPKRVNQGRGVPLVAPVAEYAKQISRVTEAETMARLVASMFTVFVRDASGSGALLQDPISPEETVTGGGSYGPDDTGVYDKNYLDGNDLEMSYGNVIYLDDNKDISLAQASKSDKDFGVFWDAIASQVTAGMYSPLEQAQLKYTTSYTAARAATNDVMRYSRKLMSIIASQVCKPVMALWFDEAMLKLRINAPGYYGSYANREAWLSSVWVGPGQGAINPLVEAKADVIAINSLLRTREDIHSARYGGRWDGTIQRRAAEDRRIEELGIINKPDPTELVGPDGQEDADAT